MERDVCGHVLTVNVRVNQPFIDDTGVSRVVIAEGRQPSQVTPTPNGPSVDEAGLQGEEADNVFLGNVEASGNVHKSALTEMDGLEECLRRCEYKIDTRRTRGTRPKTHFTNATPYCCTSIHIWFLGVS